MEIEEAIAHAREVAEGCPAEDRQCAYQHDELADWLEELKAYRETGLSPGTVSDLLGRFHRLYKIFDNLDLVDQVHFQAFLEMTECWYQAKKEGRLVVLPCKVGDAVYVTYGEGYKVCIVDRIHVIVNNQVQVRMRHLLTETLWLSVSEFGKKVFLTSEEAEAALKKREEADNVVQISRSAGSI